MKTCSCFFANIRGIFVGFCEVYRLPHKSFVACSRLFFLLLYLCQLLDLQLIAALCWLTLKQLTVPFATISANHWLDFFPRWLRWETAVDMVQAISLCWVDCGTDTIRILIYIVLNAKGLTKPDCNWCSILFRVSLGSGWQLDESN